MTATTRRPPWPRSTRASPTLIGFGSAVTWLVVDGEQGMTTRRLDGRTAGLQVLPLGEPPNPAPSLRRLHRIHRTNKDDTALSGATASSERGTVVEVPFPSAGCPSPRTARRLGVTVGPTGGRATASSAEVARIRPTSPDRSAHRAFNAQGAACARRKRDTVGAVCDADRVSGRDRWSRIVEERHLGGFGRRPPFRRRPLQQVPERRRRAPARLIEHTVDA